jgi:translation initiation factor 2D
MKKKGLIKAEENGETDIITKINRKEASYRDHQRWREEQGEDSPEAAGDRLDVTSRAGPNTKVSSANKVEVVEVYAPTTESIRTILASAEPVDFKGKRGETLISETSVKKALAKYVADNQLFQDGAKMIVRTMTDKLLKDSLFQNSKKVGDSFPEFLTLAECWQQLSSHMIKYHVIVRPGQEPLVKKGDVRPVGISLEQRHGGRKHLTNISHLEKFGIDPERFSESCQKKFSASSSLQPLPGKQDSGLFQVQVQGEFAKEVREWLMVEYGLSKNHIVMN